ncbi:MAG TPA: hypothetical protein VID72_13980, partial [Ktedonobacterales bacterium]
MTDSVTEGTRLVAPVSVAAAEPCVAPQTPVTTERVLLADTDIATLKAVAVALRHEGRAIVTAVDGAAAVGPLSAGAFDLLLTDVRVEVNGESLLTVA